MASLTRNNINSKLNSTNANESTVKDSLPIEKYETFNYEPSSINALPEGSGQNTAGAIGRHEMPSLADAIKTVRWQDFQQVHMYPCTKDSLLTGIASAFGIGGIRAVFGATIPKAANWAVSSFILASIAHYEYCQARRSFEKTQIQKIVQVMDQKKAKKVAEEAEALEATKEKERKIEDAQNAKIQSSKWHFW